MNSIISKLSEIETAATAIVKHAESEKDRLDQKDAKRPTKIRRRSGCKHKRKTGCNPAKSDF